MIGLLLARMSHFASSLRLMLLEVSFPMMLVVLLGLLQQTWRRDALLLELRYERLRMVSTHCLDFRDSSNKDSFRF
ncbi:hypothetical protein LINGRAHAP2_LOCUS9600 [Linum grandiflorum]